jgi:hypothetical protein
MTLATRDSILGAFDSDTKDIDAKGWGTVRIRTMSTAERLSLTHKYDGDSLTNDEAAAFYCELVAQCVVDEHNEQMFSDNGDVEQLKTRDWKVIEHVADAILEFNGLKEDAVEESAKN